MYMIKVGDRIWGIRRISDFFGSEKNSKIFSEIKSQIGNFAKYLNNYDHSPKKFRKMRNRIFEIEIKKKKNDFQN